MTIKRIVIIGPESTGKSTLCGQLASHFQTEWVREYAREYLLTNGTEYTQEDLWAIAQGQMQNEDALAASIENSKNSDGSREALLFIDTDMHVMKTWSEFVFDACDNRILKNIVDRPYDLYLLCNTDLPWEKDALREYPDLVTREKLFEHYKDAMINQSVPWVEIKGGYDARLEIAIHAVNAIIRSSWPPANHH